MVVLTIGRMALTAVTVLHMGLAVIYGCDGRPWTASAILGVGCAILLVMGGRRAERAR